MKTKMLMRAKIHPLAFVHYKALALGITAIVLLATVDHVQITWLGLLTAPLSVANTMLCYIAVQRAGLVLSQPVWSISDVLTSFVVGLFFLGEHVSNYLVLSLGIALIMGGMALLLP